MLESRLDSGQDSRCAAMDSSSLESARQGNIGQGNIKQDNIRQKNNRQDNNRQENIGGVRMVWLESVDSTQDELRRVLGAQVDSRLDSANSRAESTLEFTSKSAPQSIWQAQSAESSAQKSHQKSSKDSRVDSSIEYSALCVIARSQTKGRGSRGNAWSDEGGLMFSLAYTAPLRVPDDVPPQSMAIFLGYIIKQILAELGSQIWLKYPNDLYIGEHQEHAEKGMKVGGILIEKWRGMWLCGVGINSATKSTESRRANLGGAESVKFGTLDIALDEREFFTRLFSCLQNPPSWKQIFSNYKLEFHRNYPFAFHAGDEKISLRDAQLLEDGSVRVQGRVIYNLRDREV